MVCFAFGYLIFAGSAAAVGMLHRRGDPFGGALLAGRLGRGNLQRAAPVAGQGRSSARHLANNRGYHAGAGSALPPYCGMDFPENSEGSLSPSEVLG
jgi:hypothetical protein